jgi:hypothetical protein
MNPPTTSRQTASPSVLIAGDRRAGASAYAAGLAALAAWLVAAGGFLGLVGWVGTPIWFLMAGRALRAEEILVPAGA